ncbi:hypothetical protein AB6A40_007965 [Gnathostoma spinigerum]|uniref:Bystin n=1 Tax=Gnathostoma spinigerum TaxID=75299 RepID=A0ABD6EPQ0_9BILA
MGKKWKGSKIKSGTGDLVTASALPLDQQIEAARTETQRDVPRQKDRILKRAKPANEYIDVDLSSKILSVARKQKREEESDETGKDSKRARQISLGGSSSETLSDEEDNICEAVDYNDGVVEVNAEDEEAINRFMNADQSEKTRTLWDLIQEKIEQKNFEIDSQISQNDESVAMRKLDPAVAKMYQEVGIVLSRYRSGKISKAFKMIPKMVNWEQILYLTNPEKWTAAAMYQATRIFASNLNPKMCQRFYNLVLLPRLRDDISEYKKLNFHLYQALHKAMYKPQAFFKGILLPLCESGTCTLREATIFGSVLSKSSIPVLHASVAMSLIAQMNYSGANSLFLRILIDKKFTLPYKTIDNIVDHFLRFRSEERSLPVLWHQSFLAFAQHYKASISDEQRSALLKILKIHVHHQITPEIRRELVSVMNEQKTKNVSPEVLMET